MKSLLIILVLLSMVKSVHAQFPFEKYAPVQYTSFNNWKTYDKAEKEKKIHSTLTIPTFFDNGDTLTVQLTSFTDHWWNNSIIRIFRNKTEIQKIAEDMGFSPTGLDTLRMGDINGDNLQDIKITVAYLGNGIAAMNARIIYLFQQADHSFKKISFTDKINNNRKERDFDGDGNFEIITMNLISHENHSYWLFNLYDYSNGGLVNVNQQYNYPIMIQFLYRKNYEITNKISREKMKTFALPLPDEYDTK